MHNILTVLPSYPFFPENFFQQGQTKPQIVSPGIDEHRAFGPYFLVSRIFEDEPVTLLPFHSPIRTIHTRVSLRENWAPRPAHNSSKEEKAHRAPCLPCAFHPVIQKKSQYCSPAGACREPNLSALVASKLLVASLFPGTKKGKMEKEAFLNSCLGSLTSLFGSTAAAAARSCTFCLLLRDIFGAGMETGRVWWSCPQLTAQPARQRAFLVANGNRLLLAAWLFLPDPPSHSCRQPSDNPVLNPTCCKISLAGPIEIKPTYLLGNKTCCKI